jgi:hypothetical protein
MTLTNATFRQFKIKVGIQGVCTFRYLSLHDGNSTIEITPSQIQGEVVGIDKRTSKGVTFCSPEDGAITDFRGIDTGDPGLGRGKEGGCSGLDS